MTTPRRGRPPTGCPDWNPHKQVWEARVGPTRRRIPMRGLPSHDLACACTPKAPCAARARAEHMAKIVARQVQVSGAVPDEYAETVNDWFDKFVAARVAKGLRSTRNDKSRFGKWVAPK